ncbi:unnamed protein product [Cuscuta epithymum]|uniref:Uncharacterized protein n=1 Tax=Cuscuta epithymum TaxID=186058 RepID=A0AAV0ELV2_9ASTE|nr:unnamed protein product [Cuscuta epithymum]
MSDEQLQQLLAQNPQFFHQRDIPDDIHTIDEEELEDDDPEEDAGGAGSHDTPDEEQAADYEGGSSQIGGYGSLKRHLMGKHKVEYAKIEKGKGKQTQISRFANNQPYGNFSYNDQQNLTGMANFIVEENLPYLFSESVSFKEYAQTCLNPQFRSYSRKTVKKEIIRLYKVEKLNLQIFFCKL